jgi:hypothetical protein
MCHLLTIGVSDYSGDPKEIFRAQGLDTAPPANPYVRAALPDGAVLFDVTKNGCSCSVYRGSDLGSVFDESAERARYARKAGQMQRSLARSKQSGLPTSGNRHIFCGNSFAAA